MTTTPTPATAAPSQALSILSVVVAAASIVFGHFFVLPITAIVLGFVARTREPQARTLSTVGIVLGFVVLFGWIAILAIGAAVFVPLAILHAIR